MKFSLVSGILTIFLAVLFWYLVTQVINPFNPETVKELLSVNEVTTPEEFYSLIATLADKGTLLNYLSLSRILPVAFSGTAALFFAIVAVHSVVDKLFFKEFYQAPNYKVAVRRAGIVCFALLSFIVLRLIAVDMFGSIIMLVVCVLLEIGITLWQKNRNLNKIEIEQDETETDTEE